ncbi:MAG: hypothetical protein MUF33_03055 [Candidatus Nanopelagicales bacterium]|nr:hypothetical protein [Candidatus Nanopelagicales bacterium]
MRRALVAVLSAVFVGLVVSPASATTIDEVVTSLQSDPVYNDPEAENALTDSEADNLRDQIAASGSSVFIAILPDAAKGSQSTEDVVTYLRTNVGEPGSYAAVVGSQFRSTTPAAATSAFQQQRDNGVFAVLSQYVSNVATIDSGGTVTQTETTQESGGNALLPVLVLGAVAAGVGGLFYMGKRKRDKADALALASVKETIDEDITAFGESLDSVDSAAITTDDNRADWMAALDQYDKAKRSSDTMSQPAEAATVTEALDEGRFRVACVQARLAGEPLPDRRPPCFFDPRHGLSVKDVSYTPMGTTTARDVPACAACAATVDDGLDPDVRLVTAANGGRQPYWQAGPQYGGYASGYYGNSGMDLFSTILVGTMLANMMTGPMMYGGGGWGDTGGGSDFGGGDFGGGDFGGGGFGGGDFGGW